MNIENSSEKPDNTKNNKYLNIEPAGYISKIGNYEKHNNINNNIHNPSPVSSIVNSSKCTESKNSIKTEQIILEELNKHIENKDFSGYFNNDKISYKEIREVLGNQDDYINKVVFKENKNLSEIDSKITSSLNENILDSRSNSQCNENRYNNKDIEKNKQSESNRHSDVNVNLEFHICHKTQKTIKKIEEKIETMRNKHNSISINNQNQSIYSNKRQKIKNDFQQKNDLSNRKIEQIVQKTSTYKINSTNNSKSNNSSSKIEGNGNNSTCFSWCESGNTTKK